MKHLQSQVIELMDMDDRIPLYFKARPTTHRQKLSILSSLTIPSIGDNTVYRYKRGLSKKQSVLPIVDLADYWYYKNNIIKRGRSDEVI